MPSLVCLRRVVRPCLRRLLGGGANLLLASEQFNRSVWVKTRASVTADAAAGPDGSSTADKVVEDSTVTNTHSAGQNFLAISGRQYTGSVYVKADGRDYVNVSFSGAGGGASMNDFVAVSLLDGSVGGTFGSPDATAVEDVGDGWYRISLTVTATATGNEQLVVFPSSANTVGGRIYSGDGVSGVYVWGAQVEVGGVMTPYQQRP